MENEQNRHCSRNQFVSCRSRYSLRREKLLTCTEYLSSTAYITSDDHRFPATSTMCSTQIQQPLKKSSLRVRKRKAKPTLRKKSSPKLKPSTRITCYPPFLANLKQPGTPFLSYTALELEPICHQIAIEQMASSPTLITSCPWICLLCEDLIVEPITLYCGHTYCEPCLNDAEETSADCLRCSKNIQGQIASPITYARQQHYSRNLLLKEAMERSEVFRFKCENILACHRARDEYAKGNYLQAVDVLSDILEKGRRTFASRDEPSARFTRRC